MSEKKSLFICPVCGESLNISERKYYCVNRHSFDMAKSGYVNLMLSNQMNAKNPGDNKLMVKARNDFLEKGYYLGLLLAIEKAVMEISEDIKLVDAGCGEGYYTNRIYNALKSNGRNVQAAGIDISKYALNSAAKRNTEIEFAVGSIFHLPVADNSCNVLLNIFAPFCLPEFSRVIVSCGFMIMVIPGKRHLWQLKEIVYENPYENELKSLTIEGFDLYRHYTEKDKINIDNNDDIMNLFAMTPYYYRTGEKDKQKLLMLKNLETEIEFEILVYRKKGE